MKEFLTAAELILRRFERSLSVNEIVSIAIEENVLRSKGNTPENTMRARLSEHIREYGQYSKFIRVGKNKFALREYGYEEYHAEPFLKKAIEYVVCIKQEQIDKIGRFFGFTANYRPYLNIFKDPRNIIIKKRDEANLDYSIKQLVSYVLIKNSKGEILSHVRGNYSNVKDRLLQGVLNIGFGGHVNNEDFNLFGISDGGAQNAAVREIREELKNIQIIEPKLIGVINDDSTPLGLNHFAFVYTTTVVESLDLVKISAELSINQLKFLNINNLINRFSDLEFWSQLLVKNVLLEKFEKQHVLIRSKRGFHIQYPVIVVGEIGSGKTEIAKLISRKQKAHFFSSRDIVANLIDQENFGLEDRTSFQNKSFEFIKKRNGCAKIAEKVIDICHRHGNVIIDGIRQVETYDFIKEKLPSAVLIYIDLPIDSSFDFFKRRSKRDISIHEFREARSHLVEKDITLLKHRADVYIYNGSTFEDLVSNLTSWLDEKI
jgi:predicted NUDIX family phosphoesterase/dephospho-CoA kinase